MILSSQSTCSILLALSFLFNRAYGDRGIIGFRTVQSWEAQEINKLKRPLRDKRFDKDYGRYHQLGNGFYTINQPAGWKVPDWWTSWYCVIEADLEKFSAASKVWIPEHYTEVKKHGKKKSKPTKLWNWQAENEETILKYIESMSVPNPEKALRFAYVPIVPGSLQMVIPTHMINSNDLDFTAQCWETKQELFAYSSDVVDWMQWEIAGDPNVPDPKPSGSSNKASWYRGWLDCIAGSGTCA
ncbi:hypothetical protein LZ554_007907 [Drepanopeziza brunnea f. sp. 'monogermtubi']|nr:hypothetical protein LZ554_007907 [Drepanopeziza brunnea f. sp. 'monogermtubi']